MLRIKKTIITAVVALAFTSALHADMMPLSPVGSGSQQSLPVCVERTSQERSDSSRPAISLATIDLGSSPVGCLAAAGLDARDNGPTKPPQVLTDGQNSFSLCLYALMGLGLCRTAPWIKRLHIGLIPDWYHTGGPYQIGHSFAVSPDCLSPAMICSFLQSDSTAETQDLLPQYRWGTMLSLWRKSQYTPTVLASRGPPALP